MCNACNLRHRNEAILDIARTMQLPLADLVLGAKEPSPYPLNNARPRYLAGHRVPRETAINRSVSPRSRRHRSQALANSARAACAMRLPCLLKVRSSAGWARNSASWGARGDGRGMGNRNGRSGATFPTAGRRLGILVESIRRLRSGVACVAATTFQPGTGWTTSIATTPKSVGTYFRVENDP